MKEVANYWFTSPGGVCGIVVVEDESTEERQAYLCESNEVDYKIDREGVLALGSKLPNATIEDILKNLKGGKAGKQTIEVGAMECGVLYGLILQSSPSEHTILNNVLEQLTAIKLTVEKEAGVTKEMLPGGLLRSTDKDGNVIVRPPFPYETEGN